MVRSRVPETDHGIQGEINVETYDKFMKNMRDRGWLVTKLILESSIVSGNVLEIGPGPGYLGLEWLKKTNDSMLRALEISGDMIRVARINAQEYNLKDRVEYVQGNAGEMPFKDNTFVGVFSNGSLHEWGSPEKVFTEIYRVLKPQGKFIVSDLRRDMSVWLMTFLKMVTRPREIRPGLISSINASYTCEEINQILKKTGINDYRINHNAIGLWITGIKST